VKDKTKNWIIAILFLIVLTGAFWLGYSRYPAWNKLPEGKDSIVYIYDTVPKYIIDSFPAYRWRIDSIKYRDPKWMDSVILANKVDTAKLYRIYEAFYSINYYDRNWEDTLIKISVKDVITENRPIENKFVYTLLKPLAIIDNTTTNIKYSKYIYLGGSITLPSAEYSSIGIYGAFPRSFWGLSYIPYHPGAMLTGGFKIIKLR